jgi:hypothetical protein
MKTVFALICAGMLALCQGCVTTEGDQVKAAIQADPVAALAAANSLAADVAEAAVAVAAAKDIATGAAAAVSVSQAVETATEIIEAVDKYEAEK